MTTRGGHTSFTRGRGGSTWAARDIYINARKKLRDTNQPQTRTDSPDEVVKGLLAEYIEQYDQRRHALVSSHGVTLKEFKAGKTGDFYMERCRDQIPKADVSIKYWINLADKRYEHYVSQIRYQHFKSHGVGDGPCSHQNEYELQLKAIVWINSICFDQKCFVDVYADHVECPIMHIKQHMIGFFEFQQICKEYTKEYGTDIDAQKVWYTRLNVNKNGKISKQELRTYQNHVLEQSTSKNKKNPLSHGQFRVSANIRRKQHLRFDDFKALYYEHAKAHIPLAKNVMNEFQLRKCWRENLNEDFTGTITWDEWDDFASVELAPVVSTACDEPRIEQQMVSVGKTRGDTSWIRHPTNYNVKTLPISHIKKVLEAEPAVLHHTKNLPPHIPPRSKHYLQSQRDFDDRFKTLQRYWTAPEPPPFDSAAAIQQEAEQRKNRNKESTPNFNGAETVSVHEGQKDRREPFRFTLHFAPRELLMQPRKRSNIDGDSLPSHLRNLYEPEELEAMSHKTTKGKAHEHGIFHQFSSKPFGLPCITMEDEPVPFNTFENEEYQHKTTNFITNDHTSDQ